MNQSRAFKRHESVIARVLSKIAKALLYVLAIPFTPASHRRAARPPDLPLWLRDDIGLPPVEKRPPKTRWDQFPPL